MYRFLGTGENNQGRYAIREATVPPGGGPPLHVHSREDEGFYVLDGEMTFQVEGETVIGTPGTFVNLPPGVRHRFRKESQTTSQTLLAISVLAGVLSLPLEWFTLTNVVVDSSSFSGSVSALDGASLFAIPVWAIVAIAIIAGLLQLLDATRFCAIPRFVTLSFAIIALIAMSVTIIFPIAAHGVTANEGAFFGFLSAAIPTIALAIGMQKNERMVAG